jgi:hypothetical protein
VYALVEPDVKLRLRKIEIKFYFRVTSETENYFWLVAHVTLSVLAKYLATKDFVYHEDSQRYEKTTQLWKMRYALHEEYCG